MTPADFISAPVLPAPPDSTQYVDLLHWCLKVMKSDDRDLGFVASLLSYATKGGLTEKQGVHAGRIIDKLRAQYRAGMLD